jgi:hypothetical protein
MQRFMIASRRRSGGLQGRYRLADGYGWGSGTLPTGAAT